MWIFVPSLVFGVLGTLAFPVAYGAQLILSAGDAHPPLMLAVYLPFSIPAIFVSLLTLTGRTQVVFDPVTRTVTHRFRSRVWSTVGTFSYDDVRAVQLATVNQARNADTLPWVPRYQMVLLVNESHKLRAHIWSAAPTEARALADTVGALIGAPVEVP